MTLVWIFFKKINPESEMPHKSIRNLNRNRKEENLKHIFIKKTDNSTQIKQKIHDAFNFASIDSTSSSNKLRIRLRRTNGNFLPINEDLEPNTKSDPYILETYLPQLRVAVQNSTGISPKKVLDSIDLSFFFLLNFNNFVFNLKVGRALDYCSCNKSSFKQVF
jgi:hypothetical protein